MLAWARLSGYIARWWPTTSEQASLFSTTNLPPAWLATVSQQRTSRLLAASRNKTGLLRELFKWGAYDKYFYTMLLVFHLPIECKISIEAFRSVLMRDWALWNSTTAAVAIFPIQNQPARKQSRGWQQKRNYKGFWVYWSEFGKCSFVCTGDAGIQLGGKTMPATDHRCP